MPSRRISSDLTTSTLKPFKDFLPNLPTYSCDDAPEVLLTQFRTHARHLGIPPELLPPN